MELAENRTGSRHGLSRRGFLTLGLLSAFSTCLPLESIARAKTILLPERSLSFYNTHTGESLTATYWCQGSYIPQALAEINHVLRDHRTGEVKNIDPDLLDLLHTLHGRLKSSEPFHLISGYRSPKTNAFLRQHSSGVAQKSLHTCGKAVDIRLPDRNLNTMLQAAVALKGGGVGYYPKSDFIHVDVGRVRYW